MEFLSKKYSVPKLMGWTSCLAMLLLLAGCKKWDKPPAVIVTTFVAGLTDPSGIDTDHYGNLWISEGNTVNNDGMVWLIRPNGKKFKAIINLSAFKNAQSGEPQGTVHLLFDKGILYVLSGDYLYKIDVSGFKPGDAPIDARKQPFEDVGAFIYGSGFPDSHAYNLTKGPDGLLYIADAGANAIVKRHGPSKYSILAKIPGFKNPNPAGPPPGPPIIEAVPTAIMHNGRDFLVTTLTGFPFLSGKASIYKVSMSGKVSLYQTGFTTLVDIASGNMGNHIAVQYADFGPTGFVPNSGSLVWTNGNVPLVKGLELPVAIKQHDACTWYVACTGTPGVAGSGTIKKITYK